jgi:hypothetical protein
VYLTASRPHYYILIYFEHGKIMYLRLNTLFSMGRYGRLDASKREQKASKREQKASKREQYAGQSS